MKRAWLLAILAFLPSVGALQHEGGLPDAGAQDLQARGLHVLQYHPYPDPAGDPWGIAGGTRNGTVLGYMEAAYNAYEFPTAVLDGVERVEGAPTFLETYNTYESLYLQRAADDAPVRIAVMGSLNATHAWAEVDLQPKRALDSRAVEARVVLFEDEIPFDGGNGVDLHRFTARAIAWNGTLDLGANASSRIRPTVELDDAWNVERLGFVVSLHNRDAGSTEFELGEVLQATTYQFSQSGPTIQHRRGVLLEVFTATWCAACVFGDAAVDELSNAYGIQSSRFLNQRWEYLRDVDGSALIVAALVGVAGGGAAWATEARRRPPS